MNKKKKENHTFNKIEIDEKTSEPKIVEVSIKEIEVEAEEQKKAEIEKNYDPIARVGNQMSLNLKNLKVEKNDVARKQKIFKLVVTLVFAAFILGVLIYTAYFDFFANGPIEWHKVGSALKHNWYYFIFALCALGFCFFSKGFKLSYTCKLLTGKWHFKTCMETGVIGHYYNSVTPLAVGGQPFEIYHLSKNGVHGGVAASLPIATFFLNQFALVVLGLVSFLFIQFGTLGMPVEGLVFPTYMTLFTIIGLISCFAMPLLVVLFSIFPRIGGSLVKFVMFLGKKLRLVKNPEETTYKTIKNVVHTSKCIKTLAKKPICLTVNLIISLIEQLALSSIAYFTLKAFGFPQASGTPVTLLEWAQVLQICFVCSAAVSFIPTPGNSGAADIIFFSMFEVGLLAGLTFPAMMIWRTLSFYSFIIIGFIFLTVKKRKLARSQNVIKE